MPSYVRNIVRVDLHSNSSVAGGVECGVNALERESLLIYNKCDRVPCLYLLIVSVSLSLISRKCHSRSTRACVIDVVKNNPITILKLLSDIVTESVAECLQLQSNTKQ